MTEFVYNNVEHAFINMSSFRANLTYNSRMSFEKKSNFKSKTSATLNKSTEFRQLHVVLKNELISAQRNQQKFENARNIFRAYKIDDKV